MHTSFIPIQEILEGGYITKKVAIKTCELSEVSLVFISLYIFKILRMVFTDEH